MKPLRVFLCSTSADLRPERTLVLDAIRRLQLQHQTMEFFGARPGLPIDTCLAEVRRSDLVIVIVGERYGSLVPGTEIGFSEAEYQEAQRLNKPVLVYLRNPTSLPSDDPGSPDTIRLRAWKAHLTPAHTAAFFDDAQGLSVQVVADIARFLLDPQSVQPETPLPTPPLGFVNWYEGTRFEPAPFGGRDAELAALHAWLPGGDEPYALLTAPIGRGKSALVSRFVSQVRLAGAWHVVFVPISVRFGSSQPAQFLRDLVRHLARLQGRTVPPQATAAEWDALWRECFSDGPPAGHRPVLLVIDALDEAQNWTPDAGFLPDLTGRIPDLTSRLRILVTARDPADGSRWRRHLGWTSPRLARGFTLSTLDGPGVFAAMASLGHPLDTLPDPIRWTAALLRVTQGEPLLVRFYAAELLRHAAEGTELTLEALARRPPGLAGYVEDWWTEQQALWGDARDRRAAEVTALLDVLAVARGPLTLADLLALRRGGDGPGAVRQAIDTARRFLAGDGSDDDPFVLGHPALAEFFRERLTVPEAAVHARFVEWGHRVVASLPPTSSDADKSAPAPRYLFTTLRDHLKEAGASVTEWSRLLAIPWVDASIRATSSADAVIADLNAVWDVLEADGRDDTGPGVPKHWPEIVTCGLIQASLLAEREAVPVPLACRAAAVQYWSLARFLIYVSSRTEKGLDTGAARLIAQTLLDLGSAAVRAALRTRPPDDVIIELCAAYGAALSAAGRPAGAAATQDSGAGSTSDDHDDDDDKIATVKERPDTALLEALFEAAETTLPSRHRPSPVAALAPFVRDGWARALAAAEAMEHPSLRARSLIEIAPHVADGWTRALAAAEAIEEPLDRAHRLLSIAPHVPDGWTRVLEAAELEDYDYMRSRIITDVAPHVPGGWEKAVEAAEALKEPAKRAWELIHIAPHVPEGWMRAYAAADLVDSAIYRARALFLTAPHVPDSWDVALRAAEAISRPDDRAAAVARVAPHLPDGWARALAAAEAIEHDRDRADAMAVIAPHLPDGWARALAAAEAFASDRSRAYALATVAPHVPDGWPRALAAAEAVRHPVERAEALIKVAPHVPEGWSRAYAAVDALRDPTKRRELLAKVALHAEEALPAALSTAAATAADDGTRALALVALAPNVPDGWSRAMIAAESTAQPLARAHVTSVVAPHVPDGWMRALRAAEAIEDDVSRAAALFVVAPHVPDGWSRVLAAVERIEDAGHRAWSLVDVAPHVPGGWDRAQSAVEALTDASSHAAAMFALAPHLPDGWNRAWNAAEKIENRHERTRTLIAIAPHVPQGWTRALDAVRSLSGSLSAVRTLAEIIPHVPEALLTAQEIAERMRHPGDRALCLVVVAPYLPDGWSRVMAATEAVAENEPSDCRVRALIAAAPHVPGGWERMLLATVETCYPKDRGKALAAAAPDLPEEMLVYAIVIAKAIEDTEPRMNALTALAARVPSLLPDLNWDDSPTMFDLVVECRAPLEGRIRLFRREFSAPTTKPAQILGLVADHNAERWPLSPADAARLATAIEDIGRRWP